MTAEQRLTKYKGKYLGLHEFAEVLGISKQAASNRRSRGKLPEPVVELAMSPIWTRRQVKKYLRQS